ncbi:MAG: ATP-binding protein [Actinomycetota bacterium]|nr:ATP-binding protein [Actinomycetota bacterium]
MAVKDTEPMWPTEKRARFSGGRVQGVDGKVWLYKNVPLEPVVDAKTGSAAFEASVPILRAVEELAARTRIGMARRATSKGEYRKIHMQLVNVPAAFIPPDDTGIAPYLRGMMPHETVQNRVLLFGVQLRAKLGGGGGWQQKAASAVESLVSGGTPLSDYDADYADMDALLAQSGMTTPDARQFALADSWWNFGRAPDTPMLEHPDHVHVFTEAESVRVAAKHGQDCKSWPEVPNHHILSFGTVREFDLGYTEASSHAAQWVDTLVVQDAMCVSIRAAIEPTKVTREELRRRKRQYQADLEERVGSGAMERAELDEKLEQISDMEAWYSGPGAQPTLTETSVVFALGGHEEDMANLGSNSGLILSPMAYLQMKALRETMIASRFRASPYLHDLPSQTIACSALPSLSIAGDRRGQRILTGMSERDAQPCWLSPTAAASEDSLPMLLVAGQTGSGKTQAMLWFGDQLSRLRNHRGERTPVIMFDPKMGSDHTEAVKRSGGQVYSLDDLLSADGVFDALRFSKSASVGIELASSLLMSVNPWGSKKLDYETDLLRALQYGVDHGATCTGHALKLAAEAPDATVETKEMVAKAFDVAEVSPMFRAFFGVDPQGVALSAAEGITLIKVGTANLSLPEPGAGADVGSLTERAGLALIRAIVYGSMMALMDRQGALLLDEAWVVLAAGRKEMERVGREARSQGVLPILFTQRVTDALNAGLAGYISRGLILPIQDPAEAEAACKLFQLEATPARMTRITAKATVGEGETGAPNWRSMRALRDQNTGRILRGSVGIYSDLAGRAVPVEIKIPAEFLAVSSTNPDDIQRRKDAAARVAQEEAKALERGQASPLG